MIHWKGCDEDYSPGQQARWRREYCAFAEVRDGKCAGYGRGRDDEPHEICKACDRHSLWEGCDAD